MSRRGSVRDAVVETLEGAITRMFDGRDESVPEAHSRRLADAVAGMTTVVPGWAAGPALGLGPAERASWYRLTGDDTLVPVRPARDCVIRPVERTCRRPHDHWEEIADAAA